MGSVSVFGGSQSALGGGGRIVLYEQFTGDGSDKTFQLTNSPANATWGIGTWAAGNIVTTLPLHVTSTAYKEIYDGVIWGVRNRVTVNNVNASGLVTLDYAPRDSVDFYIFYWYGLSASENISAYWRPEFIASLEAPFLSDTSYGSYETVLDKTGDYTITTADAGKRIVVNKTSLVTLTLPSVTANDVGMVFKFTKKNTGNVKIQASDSDTIVDSAAGGYILESSGLAYATVNLVLVSETEWHFKDYPLGQWETDA